MSTQFKKGVLELCVLAVLRYKACYGYELVQTISENIEITEGTIYPLLRRLKKDGYCETYIEESEEGPARKYYRLTEKGKEYKETMENEWTTFVRGVTKILEKGENHE